MSSCGGLKWRTRSVREPSRSSVQVLSVLEYWKAHLENGRVVVEEGGMVPQAVGRLVVPLLERLAFIL